MMAWRPMVFAQRSRSTDCLTQSVTEGSSWTPARKPKLTNDRRRPSDSCRLRSDKLAMYVIYIGRILAMSEDTTKTTRIDRRQAMRRLGLGLVAAYVAPSVLTISDARADSGGSGGGSGGSGGGSGGSGGASGGSGGASGGSGGASGGSGGASGGSGGASGGSGGASGGSGGASGGSRRGTLGSTGIRGASRGTP